ncbi:MAG: acetate--CoA ligase family protein [Alphaproteobacteria bacterium]
MPGRLDRLLRPRTIAVFGGREAERVIAQCDQMGFSGEIWPVHPRHEELGGRRCYRSVADLPGAPDASFIGVNRNLTIDVARDLAERGAGGAVCYASGFREAEGETGDGASLQDALLAVAGDMPIIGPNCYGLINYLDGALLWPDQHGGKRLEADGKGVAIITQSSNIAINLTMQRRGLPLSYVLTAGNQAQTGLSDLASGMLDDPRVTAIGLHIEGFDDIGAFEAMAARARVLKMPLVAMKVGRSSEAKAATISHTASLAGSDTGATALLKHLGIARVDSIPVFLETLKLLHVHGALSGFDIASMSCSGGEASIMADAAAGSRLRFRPLTSEDRARVRSTLGPLVAVANPLDYHTFIWGNEDALTGTFAAMVGSGFDLSMLVLDFPRADLCEDADWWPTVRAFEAALETTGQKGAIVASMPENLPEAHAGDLVARGVVPFLGVEEAIRATEAAATIGEAWNGSEPAPLVLSRMVEADPVILDEAEAKARLAAFGIAVPESRTTQDAAQAVAAAEELGYPVAVKALGVAHKTEAGAVRLDLGSAEEVREAAHALLPLGAGLFVERMVEGCVAELIVGVVHDRQLGPMLTVGAGGVLVELMKDAATLLLPTSEDEVRAAVLSLKLAPLLSGFGGRPAADMGAAVDAVLAVGRFAEAHADRLEELDINPLMVCPKGMGAYAADALIRLREDGR